MALPGHRRTSSDKRRRAAHFALKKVNITKCVKCEKPSLPHHACKNCGTYKGKEVIDMARETKRILKRSVGVAPLASPKEEKAEKEEKK